VETGIAIDPADLSFIDSVESRLAARLGREATVRCRVTHAGIVIELEAANDPECASAANAIGRSACLAAGRTFAGVRPYARGAAFLRTVSHG
jgi:uncharacterized protein